MEYLVPFSKLLKNKVEEVQNIRVNFFIVISSIVVHGKNVMLTLIAL